MLDTVAGLFASNLIVRMSTFLVNIFCSVSDSAIDLAIFVIKLCKLKIIRIIIKINNNNLDYYFLSLCNQTKWLHNFTAT